MSADKGSKPASPEKLAYRIDEACAAMGLGKTTIYELIKEGKLRTRKVGNRTLIPAEDLRRLVA